MTSTSSPTKSWPQQDKDSSISTTYQDPPPSYPHPSDLPSDLHNSCIKNVSESEAALEPQMIESLPLQASSTAELVEATTAELVATGLTASLPVNDTSIAIELPATSISLATSSNSLARRPSIPALDLSRIASASKSSRPGTHKTGNDTQCGVESGKSNSWGTGGSAARSSKGLSVPSLNGIEISDLSSTAAVIAASFGCSCSSAGAVDVLLPVAVQQSRTELCPNPPTVTPDSDSNSEGQQNHQSEKPEIEPVSKAKSSPCPGTDQQKQNVMMRLMFREPKLHSLLVTLALESSFTQSGSLDPEVGFMHGEVTSHGSLLLSFFLVAWEFVMILILLFVFPRM
jgi:hypothetical protein